MSHLKESLVETIKCSVGNNTMPVNITKSVDGYRCRVLHKDAGPFATIREAKDAAKICAAEVAREFPS